jgi:hypothetical protein
VLRARGTISRLYRALRIDAGQDAKNRSHVCGPSPDIDDTLGLHSGDAARPQGIFAGRSKRKITRPGIIFSLIALNFARFRGA